MWQCAIWALPMASFARIPVFRNRCWNHWSSEQRRVDPIRLRGGTVCCRAPMCGFKSCATRLQCCTWRPPQRHHICVCTQGSTEECGFSYTALSPSFSSGACTNDLENELLMSVDMFHVAAETAYVLPVRNEITKVTQALAFEDSLPDRCHPALLTFLR